MKKNRSVDKPAARVKSIKGIAFSDEQEDKLPDESLNLSPERIMKGASIKTAVLNQILAQQEAFHQLRDWGINE